MQAVNFEETLEKMLQRDGRYDRHAYLFVREALDYTQKTVEKKAKDEVRHVSGQELLAGIRSYALEQFGPMAEIVFNMVESNLLAKTTQDSLEDFKTGYNFFEAFRRPFLPATEITAPEPEPKSTQV